MAFDREQFKDLIERTLKDLGLYSETAVNLLLGTAAQESGFGTYLRQIGGGPALGVFQMEPFTEECIWSNYLEYRPKLAEKIIEMTRVAGPDVKALEGNLMYQIVMARLHYYRVRAPLPKGDDAIGLALYWKNHYNTRAGAGKVSEFVDNYHRYVGLLEDKNRATQ